MLFMHYIVSNGKFRKVLDSLSIVFFFLFTLFLLFSKDICLCDDCKFNQRIFKSSPCMAATTPALCPVLLWCRTPWQHLPCWTC